MMSTRTFVYAAVVVTGVVGALFLSALYLRRPRAVVNYRAVVNCHRLRGLGIVSQAGSATMRNLKDFIEHTISDDIFVDLLFVEVASRVQWKALASAAETWRNQQRVRAGYVCVCVVLYNNIDQRMVLAQGSAADRSSSAGFVVCKYSLEPPYETSLVDNNNVISAIMNAPHFIEPTAES